MGSKDDFMKSFSRNSFVNKAGVLFFGFKYIGGPNVANKRHFKKTIKT